MNEAFPSRRSHTATGKRIACLESLRECFFGYKATRERRDQSKTMNVFIVKYGRTKGKAQGEEQAQKGRNHGEIRSGRHVSEALSG